MSVVVAESMMGAELDTGWELAGVVSLDTSVGVAGATGVVLDVVPQMLLTKLSHASLSLVPVLDGVGAAGTEEGVTVSSWLLSEGVAGREEVVSLAVGWRMGTGVDCWVLGVAGSGEVVSFSVA